jgi:aryl-alcohol dehydrogenase-like predicted oxidoreductase
MAQLAMAWCIRNPDISTAITGTSSPAQLEETIKAVEIMKKITNEIDSRIEKAFTNTPEGKMNFLKGKKSKSRRLEILNYE